MKLKYVMTEYGPIIFKTAICHKDVSKGLGNIISAGFFTFAIKNGNIDCTPYGESISLGIKSNPDEDKIQLDKMFNNDVYY